MSDRAVSALLIVLGVALATGACRTAPIYNVGYIPVFAAPGATLTLADVARAIARAGQRRGWVIEEVRPGELTGTLTIRRHVAVVSIVHDTSQVSITYKDSTKLKHQGGEIHHRYNGWIRNLEEDISREVRDLSPGR